MKFVKQKQGLGTCGAVAYAAILELTELQAIRECNTKLRGRGAGTHDVDVQRAFTARGIKSHSVELDRVKIGTLFWPEALSTHFPLYVSTSEHKNSTTHAIAIADGFVYDGHNDGPMPLDNYADKWIEGLIVVDKELPDYGKDRLAE